MGPLSTPPEACRRARSDLILRPMSSEGAKAFIARWAAASASERANSQPFLCELCDLLGEPGIPITQSTCPTSASSRRRRIIASVARIGSGVTDFGFPMLGSLSSIEELQRADGLQASDLSQPLPPNPPTCLTCQSDALAAISQNYPLAHPQHQLGLL
jgi:hypothetical protein